MARTKTATKPAAPIAADQRLHTIGVIRSTLKSRSEAPRQGREGAPDAWLEVRPSVAKGLDGIAVRQRLFQTLENNDPAPFARNETVRLLIKRVTASSWR